MATGKRYLSLKSASELYDVKISTLRTWIAYGRLKASKVGRDWRVSVEELERVFKAAEWQPGTPMRGR